MAKIKEIQELFRDPEDSYAIHYSYLDLDSSNGVFKKVISIHARNLDSSDSREFSIDSYVLKKDIPLEDIEDWLDEVELIVLDDFNSFLREKYNCNFIFFGEGNGQGLILNELQRIFEARNTAESNKQFKEISSSNRKSVYYLLQFDSQAKSLKDFIKLYNKGTLPTGFLTNGSEGACFEKKQFNKVRESITCKIDFIIRLLNSINSGEIINKGDNNEALDLENMKPGAILKNMNIKSWLWLIGIAVAIFGAGAGFNNYFNSNQVKELTLEKKSLETELKNNKTNSKKIKERVSDSISKVYEKEITSLNRSLDSIKKGLMKKSKRSSLKKHSLEKVRE